MTANGTYTPAEGVDGFSGVTVAVPERIPVTESLSVTENGTYEPSVGVDGYSDVTVNVPIPTDPNVIEGEFIGEEAGVLTIDLPYTGDSYPKAINIWDADGIVKTPNHKNYTMSLFSAFKSYADLQPSFNEKDNNNSFRIIELYTDTVSYTTGAANNAYIFSQENPSMSASTSVRMPDNKTLKVYVTDVNFGTSVRFRTDIRYKYQIFY